jgi:hypothetical protein
MAGADGTGGGSMPGSIATTGSGVQGGSCGQRSCNDNGCGWEPPASPVPGHGGLEMVEPGLRAGDGCVARW